VDERPSERHGASGHGASEYNGEQDPSRILHRLARVEGQVRGLRRMLEEGKDCEQILTQLAAVRSALDGVGAHLIAHHLRECLREEMGPSMDPSAFERAFSLLHRYVNCLR